MPTGKGWVHEVALDGYRVLVYLQDNKVRMLTRYGHNWTHRFQPIAELLARFPAKNAIIDGAIAVCNPQGVSRFRLLQEALERHQADRLLYYAFDLLYADNENLAAQPLLARKRQLALLLAKKALGGRILYSEHIVEPGNNFLENLCERHMGGVISKQADAPYTAGHSRSWLKTSCYPAQEFVIGGYTLPDQAQRDLGALLVGYYENGALTYAGKVGTGFGGEKSRQLRHLLDPIRQHTIPFSSITAAAVKGAVWVKPQLVCKVEFTAWTADSLLLHPAFQGLREDKPAADVRRDSPDTVTVTVMKPLGYAYS
jgi:bifunctional non-homologous end joining protein LigD